MPDDTAPVVVIFGPTASGKTALLEALFTGGGALCAAEVISADSAQVYRGLDIGTAKPAPALRSILPHHLIDIREPDEDYNAGEFTRLAREAVTAIRGRGALPVISGGTGFYIKNFIYGLPEAPPSDRELRVKLKEELAGHGAARLMAELAEKDAVSAARIHVNDHYRLLRALEVLRLSGRPLSSFNSFSTGTAAARANTLVIALERGRDGLYRRIDERCGAMFEQGLAKEARGLYERGFTPADRGLSAIGYREFFAPNGEGGWEFLGENEELRGEIKAEIAKNSRRYAKRQITYFNSVETALRVSLDGVADFMIAADKVKLAIEGFLAGACGV
ncbi:MAG: tRNA (adenosine(37)-N6)-dimethylallyltransferase MiaA [Spirochaetaceae bacterium]|jgi:tRNA dimethylallyltransferase|nr:tRNA (adenosine(37)-N6)-dimethylallyltransferase MiaA [Spirochaetaceae bacterium]